MKSPFPGMDPYLEAHWRDVHHGLVIYARDQLQAVLPRDLRARVEERVFIESPEGLVRSVYPDVRVIERPRAGAGAASARGGRAVAEPIVIHVPDEPVNEGFIEIREVGDGGRVITVIEFLSLTNKVPGEGQDLYRQKQRELKEGRVSLVEVDLLRAGQQVLPVPREALPPEHRTPYQVCVRRGSRPAAVEVFRVPLREPLPVIPVPLRGSDPDAPLDLQALIERCYEGGGYDDIDYGKDPVPPLDPEDATWADHLLREKGSR